MAWYRIESTSGAVLGIVEAESREDALDVVAEQIVVTPFKDRAAADRCAAFLRMAVKGTIHTQEPTC